MAQPLRKMDLVGAESRDVARAIGSASAVAFDLAEPARAKHAAPSWTDDGFSADVWRSNNPNPASSKELVNFVDVPASFRLAVKEFVAALDHHVEHGLGRRRTRAASSANSAAGVLRHLAKFLHARGIAKFADASGPDVEAALVDFCGLLDGVPVTRPYGGKYLFALSRLHALGPHGVGVVCDGLAEDPADHAPNVGIVDSLRPSESTPTLREDFAKELISLAVDWVENKGATVLWLARVSDALLARRPPKARQWHFEERLRAVRLHAAENEDFFAAMERAREVLGRSIVSFLPAKYQGSAAQEAARVKHGVTDVELDCIRLDSAMVILHKVHQAACYVVCASFNGWRASEIMSIEAEFIRQTPAGAVVGSRIRKTGASPRQVVDRPVPQIVARSISSLSLLTMREKPSSKSGASRTARSGPVFRTPSGSIMRSHDVQLVVNEATRLLMGKEEQVNSHQFRRFFAYFFLRRFQGGLDAVRRHFRHVSRDMVWAYAQDAMNAEHLVNEKADLAMEIAKAVIEGVGYASPHVARDLREIRSSLRLGAKVLSVEAAAAYIEREVASSFKDVHAMEWGYCLFQSGQKGAACEAKTGPIEDRAEPGACGRCKFLCTGSENVDFWRQSAVLHQELLDHPRTTRIMRAESERFLSTATQILNRHDERGPSEKGNERDLLAGPVSE